MTKAYSLDSFKILLETYIAPDRTPKTCTVARYNCVTILENINWKCFLLSGNLLLEIRCTINFAVCYIEFTNLVAIEVNEDS